MLIKRQKTKQVLGHDPLSGEADILPADSGAGTTHPMKPPPPQEPVDRRRATDQDTPPSSDPTAALRDLENSLGQTAGSTLDDERRQRFRRVEDKNLISQAHEEAIAIKENAHQEGFQEGLKQAEALLEELKGAIDQLYQAREAALINAAGAISSMAVDVAEKIIRTEVSCDSNLVLSLVKETVQRAGRDQKSLLIKVNPSDLAHVKEATAEPEFILDKEVDIVVMEDVGVDPGSCTLETRAGLIDASFSTQLELLKKLLGLGGS